MGGLTRNPRIPTSKQKRHALQTKLHIFQTLPFLIRNREVRFLAAVTKTYDISRFVCPTHQVTGPAACSGVWVFLVEGCVVAGFVVGCEVTI